ncbi:hypothetical protein HL42_1654 [Trichophyton rubrum]|nr:hypothetical protein HL42_1654 [Trichophyton rubrum]
MAEPWAENSAIVAHTSLCLLIEMLERFPSKTEAERTAAMNKNITIGHVACLLACINKMQLCDGQTKITEKRTKKA